MKTHIVFCWRPHHLHVNPNLTNGDFDAVRRSAFTALLVASAAILVTATDPRSRASFRSRSVSSRSSCFDCSAMLIGFIGASSDFALGLDLGG